MKPDEEEKRADAEPQTADEFAEAIKKIRATTVSKEDYDKLVAERKTLIKALAEGDVPEAEKQEKPKPDKKELRKILSGEKEVSNATYVRAALDYRKTAIEEGKQDPFLPKGIKRSADAKEVEAADRVAAAFEEMLEEAIDEETGEVAQDGLFSEFINQK